MWSLFRQVRKSFRWLVQFARSGSRKTILLWGKTDFPISRGNYARFQCDLKLDFANTLAAYHAGQN